MPFDNNPSADIEMPFGKHAVKPLSEVPPQYLRWAYYDCNFTLYPELQRTIEQRLGLPADPSIRTGAGLYAKYLNGDTQGPELHSGTRGPGAGISRGRTPTGLEAFRQAFDRARHESLAEFRDEPEIRDLLEETLGKVRKALGI